MNKNPGPRVIEENIYPGVFRGTNDYSPLLGLFMNSENQVC